VVLEGPSLPPGVAAIRVHYPSLPRPIFLPPMSGAWVSNDTAKIEVHLAKPKPPELPVDILAHFSYLRRPWDPDDRACLATLEEALARSPYDRLWVYDPGSDKLLARLDNNATRGR